MSRKLVCIADAHVHPWRLQSQDGGYDRLRDGLSVVRQSLDLARSLGAVWVFAGDMKQPKTFWPQQALTGLHAIFREYENEGVEMVMVAGNHDAMGEGGCGLAPFADVAHVVDRPEIVGTTKDLNLVCAPWNADPAAVAELLENPLASQRILIAHGFLQGCMLGPEDTRIAKGTPIGAYGKFNVAIFGDVHKAQWRVPEAIDKGRSATWVEFPVEKTTIPTGSVLYAGSPYQQNWGERNDRAKGALVIDVDAQTAELYPLMAPIYQHFEFDFDTASAFIQNGGTKTTGNFVRVVYNGALCSVTDQLRQWGTFQRSFQFIPRKPSRQTQRFTVHAGMDKRELLTSYALARPLPDADPKVVLDALLRLGGVKE